MRLELMASGETTVAELARLLAEQTGQDPAAVRGCGGTLAWWCRAAPRQGPSRDLRRGRVQDRWDLERRSA